MKRFVYTVSAVACMTLSVYPASDPATRAQEPSFLGFDVGEERRYVLGPAEELLGSEAATWSIRLRELLGNPPDGIFVLTHTWRRADTRMELPLGTITRVASEGELRVNGRSFPVDLNFETQRHLAGVGDEVYTIRYEFRDGKYHKHVSAQSKDWSYVVMIRGQEYLDREARSGLYAFLPIAPDCSIPPPLNPRRAAGVALPSDPSRARVSGTALRPTREFADNRLCSREPLFANPGLLSLMLPALWEEGTGERGFLLLTPTGALEGPGVSLGGLVAKPQVTADGLSAVHPDVNSNIETLRYVERVRVEVGSRTREAWLFDRFGDFEAIYVDDEGIVLRADIMERGRGLSINGSIASVDPTRLQGRRLFVRLLFPSEY